MSFLPATRVSIGLVGKPNAGKSTLFSAICEKESEIGNYPFTTTSANSGISYMEVQCPHTIIGKECNPNFGFCVNGRRSIPVEIIDVPGLIEGASSGKGMGNQFLESLRDSMAVLQIFDSSGTSSADGTIMPEKVSSPDREIEQIRKELYNWIIEKMRDGWERFARRADQSGEPMEMSLLRKVSFIGLNASQIKKMAGMPFPSRLETWSDSEFLLFAEWIFRAIKPLIPVGNKADLLKPGERREIIRRIPGSYLISAEYELAANRALKNGYLLHDNNSYRISEKVNNRQRDALVSIIEFFNDNIITRTSALINTMIREKLHMITVYPVADETHWTDKNGNVLPDAYLVPAGTTAVELAFLVHTDIGANFIRAMDCKTKRIIGRDHELNNGDVIKIIAKLP